MKKLLLTTLAALSFLLSVAANTPHKQLLVFRNSGEVNLFFTDSIRTIIIEENDSLGRCQVFTTHGDSRHFIPVAEIDSVAFGGRNKIEIKPNVRILKDDIDIPYITFFDGVSLMYNPSTPSSILPSVGDLLYYDKITELLPVGICAKVVSINNGSDKISIGIETVDPSEIFSEFFFAGDASDPDVQRLARSVSRLKDCKGNLVNFSVDVSGFKSNIGVGYEFTEMVFNVLKHYYHVKCTLKPKTELDFNFKLDDTETFEKKYKEQTINLSPIAGIFVPSFDLAFFLKISASLDFNYHMLHEYSLIYEWTRQNGVSTFTAPSVMTGDNGKNEARAQLMLEGDIFAGLEVAARFGLIGDLAGVGIRVNAGPRFKGEIGLGVLQQLSQNYSPELYAKGDISMSLIGLQSQLFAYYKTFNSILGNNLEITPFGPSLSTDFFKREIHLFPPFERTTATAVNSSSIASRTEVAEPIVYPLNVGFNLEPVAEDQTPSEPLSTAFLDEMLSADNDEAIGLAYGFDLNSIPSGSTVSPERTVVRPLFKYGDYVVKAEHSGVSKSSFYSYFSHISSQNASATGGAWDVRSKTSNGTCYLVGNYTPRIKSNPLFSYMGGVGIAMPAEQLQSSIVGKWEGVMDDENVTLTFNDDSTGAMSESLFDYSLNKPQAGDVKITFTDSSIPNITLTIIDLTPNTLAVKKKGKAQTYTLNRIN